MNEGTEADGGYTVPNDIQTRINKYKEAKFSLGQLVRKESVKTVKGSRTFKKRSQQTGFKKVGEGAKIGAKTIRSLSVSITRLKNMQDISR